MLHRFAAITDTVKYYFSKIRINRKKYGDYKFDTTLSLILKCTYF